MNISTRIDEAGRSVGARTVDGRPAKTVTVSRVYPTTAEDLWEACTDAERLPRWFLPITGDLEVGGRYQLEGNAGGEILTCEPPRTFSATWEFAEQTSWIEIAIIPESENRARLELTHIAHPDDHWEQYGPGAVGIGWDLALLGLGLHLESGEQVDPAGFQEWSMSTDGLDFVRASSARWGEADIASGEDPEQARAAAERTAAFYTGGAAG